jgi:putative membrane protein
MPDTAEPQQITMMKRLVELALEQTQMSAERTFMNGERTLAVWIRTSLALMIFGIAIDRFSLLLQGSGHPNANELSSWGGGALITLGVVMAVTCGSRFVAFAIAYRRKHQLPKHHGPYLGPVFAGLVALFGIALLVILSVFRT